MVVSKSHEDLSCRWKEKKENGRGKQMEDEVVAIVVVCCCVYAIDRLFGGKEGARKVAGLFRREEKEKKQAQTESECGQRSLRHTTMRVARGRGRGGEERLMMRKKSVMTVKWSR